MDNLNKPQLQSGLGEVVSNKTSKDRNWNMGYLAMGKVIAVHMKRYTADVQILKSSDKHTSILSQEGKHACRICVRNAGFDTIHNKPYGETLPLQVGSLVLVGFLKNSQDQPIIISVLHDISEEIGENNASNILPTQYDEDIDDELPSYTSISNIQDFIHVDMEGNFEIASHTKSFIVGKEQAMDDEMYDFENLSVKNPDRTTIHVEEKYSMPKKYMAVFRDNFVDNLTNWLKIIVDSAKTSFRLVKLQQSDNKSTLLELDENGTIRVKRQLDTKSFEDSTQYSEMSISSDGIVNIQTVGEGKTEIVINPSGGEMTINTTARTKINANQSVDITSKSVNINADKLNVNSQTDLVGTSRVNGKKIIVEGDKDTDGDASISSVGSSNSSVGEAYCFTKLIGNGGKENLSISASCGVLSSIQENSGNFEFSMDKVTGNKIGNVLKWNAEGKNQLEDFCKIKGFDPKEITSQVEFLKSKTSGVEEIVQAAKDVQGAFNSASQYLQKVENTISGTLSNVVNGVTDSIKIPANILNKVPDIQDKIENALSKVGIDIDVSEKFPVLEDIVHVGDVIGEVEDKVTGEITKITATTKDYVDSLQKQIPDINNYIKDAEDYLKIDLGKILNKSEVDNILKNTDLEKIMIHSTGSLGEKVIERGNNAVKFFTQYV